MGSSNTNEKMDVVQVVGFDGSEPARRALATAAEWLQMVPGRMEVVFVAHMPTSVLLSAGGVVAVREGFDREESELEQQVAETLGRSEVKWHFQRRNGEIVPELIAAGEEQLDLAGPSTHVVLVVGGSGHKIDRYLNSTPARVIRQDRFEVVVVP
jgi:nucleotide-binding universal stress UspA family protein